ncbi:MAG TPA: 50S ribosomal protein L17 [Bacteroidales bacterium]|jgi:large subunit ribosomal protein L17|nr:50S ribosomal protein L17 [Bacteroidales bacterium]
MRHLNKINHLGRTSSHRKALMSNMAADLILRKRISTTTAKAKALRMYVEPIINKSKENTTHSRRVVFSYLQNKFAVNELFKEISTKIINRPGGYTRILKTGFREGDNAEMCIIELVDYNLNMLSGAGEGKAKAAVRKSRRGGKKKEGVEAAAAEPKKAKAKAEVAPESTQAPEKESSES